MNDITEMVSLEMPRICPSTEITSELEKNDRIRFLELWNLIKKTKNKKLLQQSGECLIKRMLNFSKKIKKKIAKYQASIYFIRLLSYYFHWTTIKFNLNQYHEETEKFTNI